MYETQVWLVVEASWSYTDTPRSVERLWKSDQPNAETSVRDNTQHSNRQISKSPGGFKLAIPAGERPQTLVLDRRPLGSANS
jgi:hypothetical protein